MADLIGLTFGILTDEIDATKYNKRQYMPRNLSDSDRR